MMQHSAGRALWQGNKRSLVVAGLCLLQILLCYLGLRIPKPAHNEGDFMGALLILSILAMMLVVAITAVVFLVLAILKDRHRILAVGVGLVAFFCHWSVFAALC